MDVKSIFGNMALLGLFIFGIMAFIIINQSNSDVNDKLTNNTLINSTYNDLESSLASSDAKTASDNFGEVPPTQQYGELEVTSIVSPTKTAKTIIIGLWNIFIVLPQAILGVSPVVASLISSMILIFLIIGIWAIWKGVVT